MLKECLRVAIIAALFAAGFMAYQWTQNRLSYRAPIPNAPYVAYCNHGAWFEPCSKDEKGAIL